MRIKIPITGTVKKITPFIEGDPDDPIRLIDIDLGNVSWKLVTLDLENEEMEIEVTAPEVILYDTGTVDSEGKPIWDGRPSTQKERDDLIENAKDTSLERMSKDDLYTLSGSPRLNNIFKPSP